MNRNLTILIVEEDADEAFFIQRALTLEGINNPVQIVRNSREAIAYLKREGQYTDRKAYPFPSVIMSNLKTPLFNGFDLLNWLREHPECMVIPFMVLSSSALETDIKRAYLLGANAYMVKPLTMEELRKVLRLTYEFWSVCEKPKIVEPPSPSENDA